MKEIYLTSIDSKIWNDFRDGSESAYSFIYQKYTPILFRYGMKLCVDRELVKDAIQDSFVYLWDAKERVSPTDSIKFYLFRIVRRIIFAKIDNSITSYEDLYTELNCYFTLPHEDFLIEAQTHQEQIKKLLWELEQLPQRQKEAVFLRFYDNLEFHQIAKVMGITQRAVYKLIYKAMDGLQKNMLLEINIFFLCSLYTFL